MAWIFFAAVVACHKEAGKRNAVQYPPPDTAIENKPCPESKGLAWQPEGSLIRWMGSQLEIRAPAGWAYIGYDENGNHLNITDSAAKIVSCTDSGPAAQCRPFTSKLPFGAGSVSGCPGQCASGSIKQQVLFTGKQVLMASGGYYNPDLPTRLLRDGETTPAVFDALLGFDGFRSELNRFYDEAYQDSPVQGPLVSRSGGLSAPKGYSLVALAIMGRAVLVVVPEAYVGGQLGYVPKTIASCACENGSCPIKEETINGTSMAYCQAGCKFTISNPGPNITPYVVNLPSYSF